MGLGYIPSDRHKDAMVPDFSITENFLLGYQEDPKYCKKALSITRHWKRMPKSR